MAREQGMTPEQQATELELEWVNAVWTVDESRLIDDVRRELLIKHLREARNDALTTAASMVKAIGDCGEPIGTDSFYILAANIRALKSEGAP